MKIKRIETRWKKHNEKQKLQKEIRQEIENFRTEIKTKIATVCGK